MTFRYFEERLSYDPGTGTVAWRERPRRHFNTDRGWRTFNSKYANKPTGALGRPGYLQIRCDKKLFSAHRIAWVLGTQSDIPPDREIDHINGQKTDNRLANLRLVTRSQNGFNTSSKKPAKCVFYNKTRGTYKVSVVANHTRHFGGSFKTLEEAEKAAKILRRVFHGDYFNDGVS